jgi:cytidine deaminase
MAPDLVSEPLTREHVNTNDTQDQALALMESARAARAHAYAPYSRFPVGAALLAEDGTVFTGCNVENASYGLTNCAERTAIFKAVSEGRTSFRAIAVVGPQDDLPCAPCGACRQVLHEFGAEMLLITPAGPQDPGGVVTTTVGALLPGAFDGAALPARGGDA